MSEGDEVAASVEATVSPVLAAYGLVLVDVEWAREGRRRVLRFFVDKPGGVTIADCQAFSREVGDVLDAAGAIDGAYDLEVSSPGLDRELRKEREFRWAVGRDLRCWVREPGGAGTEVRGRLLAVSTVGLTLAGPDGAPVEVPRALLTRVRLDPGLRPRK